MQQSPGASQKGAFLRGAYRSNIFNPVVVEIGSDGAIIISAILDDPGDDQRQIGLTSKLNRLSGPLIGMNPPKKKEIAPRIATKRELLHGDPMMNRGAVIEPGMAISIADGDIVHPAIVFAVDGDDPG